MRAALCAWFWLLCVGSLLMVSAIAAESNKADPLDWPMWRGPEGTGVSREKNLPSSWQPSSADLPQGENLVWKSDKLGTRSTPIVMNGKLYTICRHEPETTKEGEKVICADAATGKILWENIHNVFLTDAPAERVGWSSVVGDPTTGHIYAQGLCGVLKCIDGESGKTLWQHSLMEEFGILSTYGGRTNFPIVFENLLIVSGVMTGWDEYAIPAHRLIAFDTATGEAVWIQSTRLRPKDTTYSTPFVTVIDGQAAIVFGAGDGSVYALQSRTGKIIWTFDASTRGINTPPIVVDGVVYCGHAEQTVENPAILGAVFAFKATGTGDITDKDHRLWQLPRLTVGRSAPLFIDGRVYFTDDSGKMTVVDAQTGKELTKRPYNLGRIMFASAVFGDGKIYASEYGKFHILQPTSAGVKKLCEVPLSDEELLGSPIISHGKIYIPTLAAMYCIGEKNVKPAADPIPPKPMEADPKEYPNPTQVQLVPVESLIHPGDRIRFGVKLFNANGQLLSSNAKAKFTVEGAGEIAEDGTFTCSKDAGQVVAKVTAEVNGVKSAVARVRIVPPLPWTFDISDKQVPITWIGARYRHQVRDNEGLSPPCLVKITTIPLGTRSQCWMGQPDLHDYTIQADVKGSIKNGKMPDTGVINQRYTLDLMGSHQQLQIRSWTPRLELRFAKKIEFPWNPDTWYTLKFQSENKDDRVILRGKVWPKGDDEPKDWTIEAADLTPNTHGSPGLFGNASDAEIFIDNVSVTPNP